MLSASIKATLTTIFLWIFAAIAPAEEQPITPDLQTAWNAVGRVTHDAVDADQTCTGALVAPDVIIGAAHCLAPAYRRDVTDFPLLYFGAGWNNGSYAAVRKIRRVQFHPAYTPGQRSVADMQLDVALAYLESPIDPGRVAPFPLATPPPTAETLSFVGYRNLDPRAPVRSYNCGQSRAGAGVLLLQCQAVSGNSGAPVFEETAAGLSVVAMASARGNGTTFAPLLPDWVYTALADHQSGR